MCGITGYISHNELDLGESLVAMAHRGPDAKGQYSYKYNDFNVGLGHLRLSIIDLSEAANQPFHLRANGYSIIFNGEIYNYEKLKEGLVEKGYIFQSNSDTEVLLNMYIEYGVDMLNQLNGIFAFCILDTQRKKVFIVRDQLGIKPVYFYHNKELFAFASEIKGLEKIKGVQKRLDKEQITEFLINAFLYEPDTGFCDIKKISPGAYFEIDLNSPQELICKEIFYWHPRKRDININDVEPFVKNSIHEQTVSDVPVGIFFSGGIDSSIILSELRNETNAFVVQASEKEYKEAGMTSDFEYATKIADIFGANLKAISLSDDEVNGDDFLGFVQHLSWATEEPIGDFTFISSQQLSRETKKLGYTVILSGMGADEIFGGYPRYRMLKFKKFFSLAQFFINLFFSNVKSFEKKRIRFNNFLKEKDFIYSYSNIVGFFSKSEIMEMLVEKPYFDRFKNKLQLILSRFQSETDLKKAMVLDLYGFLSHNFMVADKSSMLESQEMRVPLATKDLFEVGFSLSDDELIGLRKTKKPLRNMLLKELSSSIVNRPKAGFNPPMDKAVLDIGYQKAITFVEQNCLFEIINKSSVEKIFTDHFQKKSNNTYKVFQLLYLSSWYSINK